MITRSRHESAPSAWVRLLPAEFDGWWFGMSDDWTDSLPCDGDYLASFKTSRGSAPMWVPSLCLTRLLDWHIEVQPIP